MDTNIESYIVKTASATWKPLQETGVETGGISVIALRYDKEQQRPPSILLRFEAGSSYPYHNHPGGEELFVLEGSCYINETLLNQGDYLYTPPNFKHGVRSDHGCVIMLIIPEEVEIL